MILITNIAKSTAAKTATETILVICFPQALSKKYVAIKAKRITKQTIRAKPPSPQSPPPSHLQSDLPFLPPQSLQHTQVP